MAGGHGRIVDLVLGADPAISWGRLTNVRRSRSWVGHDDRKGDLLAAGPEIVDAERTGIVVELRLKPCWNRRWQDDRPDISHGLQDVLCRLVGPQDLRRLRIHRIRRQRDPGDDPRDCRRRGRRRRLNRSWRRGVQSCEPQRDEPNENDQRGGQGKLSHKRAPDWLWRGRDPRHNAGVQRRRWRRAVFEGRRQPAEAVFQLNWRVHASASPVTDAGPSRSRSRFSARCRRTRAAVSLTPSTWATSLNGSSSK